jgi:hypothetical protein
MASSPFYMNTDGLLLILKDSSKMERDLTEEEKEKFHYDEFETMMFSKEATGTGEGGKTAQRFKEKAMKISVRGKEEDDLVVKN